MYMIVSYPILEVVSFCLVFPQLAHTCMGINVNIFIVYMMEFMHTELALPKRLKLLLPRAQESH